MSPRKTLSRLLAATLAAGLIATPAASAMPIDPVGSSEQQQDMHASTVQPPAATQDLRGEAAVPGGTVAPATKDLRGEAAATGGTGADQRGGPARSLPVLPPPTWPAYPTPLPRPVQSAPVTIDDGNDDIPLVVLAIAGTIALAGGIGIVAMRSRTRVAH